MDRVRQAIAEAQRGESLLAALALLRGSRVLAAADPQDGEAAFHAALDLLHDLPVAEHDRQLLLTEAVWTGIAVDIPAAIELLRRLPATGPDTVRNHLATMAVQALAGRGRLDDAMALLEDPDLQSAGAGAVILFGDGRPELQARALRAALGTWCRLRSGTSPNRHFLSGDSCGLFARYHAMLPDRCLWLDRMIGILEAGEDSRISATYDQVHFESLRQSDLFQLLPVMRACHPAGQTQRLIERYPELLRAAELYPNGMQMNVGPVRPPTAEPIRYPLLWNTDRFLNQQLADAHEAFRSELRAEESEPRLLASSCTQYRLAFFHIGRVQGEAGANRLEEVPDREVALLASIELAAGAMQLPVYNGIRRGPALH